MADLLGTLLKLISNSTVMLLAIPQPTMQGIFSSTTEAPRFLLKSQPNSLV
jgi:hypothetical protein